jgi:signal transduction histidine kinase
MGALTVASGYFPLVSSTGAKRVLVVEAGESLAQSQRTLASARNAAVFLAGLMALATWVFAARWTSLQKLRQEELARSARAEALSRIAAGAAHEIRNPLATIRATAELLQEGVPDSRSDDREALSSIVSEVDRLRRLTDDLLDLSADRALAANEVEMTALVQDAAFALRQRYPRLEVQVDAAGPSWILGDDLRLGQVVRNLLQNAAQAREDGRVRVALRNDGAFLSLKVEDNGPGIASSIESTLFEAFVTTRAQGSGLGLALSRRLAERHGGMLDRVPATSGAAFELRLPLHRMGGS